MNKIQTVTLPIDALNGLIHGFWRHTKEQDVGKALYYIDVTERAAENALYAILRRDASYGIEALGYDPTATKVRGNTSPAQVAVVLSNNLLHIDREQIGTGLNAFFQMLGRTTHTNSSTITIYGEPGVEKIMAIVRDVEYNGFMQGHVNSNILRMGPFEMGSNITVDNFVSMAIDPDFEKRVAEMPATEFCFGREFVFMHPDSLETVLHVLRRQRKTCVMHPDLYRYYFENVICKY